MFDCCVPLAVSKTQGVTMEQFWCLAKCNGANIKQFRFDKSSEQEFRKHIEVATTTGKYHVVTSFSRQVLGQTGDGHFSPIGGYHKDLDLVLLMDVARFKYPSYWLPVSSLWQSMGAIDAATNKPRGYFTIGRAERMSFMYRLFMTQNVSWRHVTFSLMELLPKQFTEYQNKIPQTSMNNEPYLCKLVQHIFCEALPAQLETALRAYSLHFEEETHACHEHKEQVQAIATDIESLPMFKTIQSACKNLNGISANQFASTAMAPHLITFLLLSLPLQVFELLHPTLQTTIREYVICN